MRKIIFPKTSNKDKMSRNLCRFFILSLLQLMVLAAQAQAIQVIGTVKDAKGSALSGVSVVLKGSKTGTTTNQDGQFNIEVSNQKSVLIFSLIGPASQEVIVGDK